MWLDSGHVVRVVTGNMLLAADAESPAAWAPWLRRCAGARKKTRRGDNFKGKGNENAMKSVAARSTAQHGRDSIAEPCASGDGEGGAADPGVVDEGAVSAGARGSYATVSSGRPTRAGTAEPVSAMSLQEGPVIRDATPSEQAAKRELLARDCGEVEEIPADSPASPDVDGDGAAATTLDLASTRADHADVPMNRPDAVHSDGLEAGVAGQGIVPASPRARLRFRFHAVPRRR